MNEDVEHSSEDRRECDQLQLGSAADDPALSVAWDRGMEATAPISSLLFLQSDIRTRCIGMRCVGTYIEPPTSFRYAALYSLGFATFFYSVWFPMDLLIVNGILQVGSLAMTGNTLHGNFAGQGTMSREQYLERAKGWRACS